MLLSVFSDTVFLFQSQIALRNEKVVYFEEQNSMQADLIKNSENTLAIKNLHLQKCLLELAALKVKDN